MAAVVFTGGIRSGKSAAAASLASRTFSNVAVVGFGKRGTDDEFDARIARHRADRSESWTTLEAAYEGDWIDRCASHDVVIFDCVGTWLALEIDRALEAGAPDPVARAETTLRESMGTLESLLPNAIWVTNEVGLSLVAGTSVGRRYVDALGRLNRSLMQGAEQSYLVVGGRAIRLGDTYETIEWPAAT